MNAHPIVCVRCRNVYRWSNDHAERGRSGLCDVCTGWTADDDAQVEAEAGTTSMQLEVLRFRIREIGRVMRSEFWSGWHRARQHREADRSARSRPATRRRTS